MGKLNLTQMQKRRLSVVMIVLSAAMSADAVYQVHKHWTWNRWLDQWAEIETTSDTEAATGEVDKNDDGTGESGQPEENKKEEPPQPKPHELHATLQKRNVFAPVHRPHHGLQLTGVIGDTALFNKGPMKVGDTKDGAKLVRIEGYVVTIEYQGNEETFKLFDGQSQGPPSRGGGEPRSRTPGPPAAVGAAEMAIPEDVPPVIRAKIEAMRTGKSVVRDGQLEIGGGDNPIRVHIDTQPSQ